MTDAELVDSIENCTLPKENFHHRDHVRLAWFYLRNHPVPEALVKFCDSLKRFAARNGREDLYHETITWAYLFLIRERMAAAPAEQSWEEFSRANKDLLTWNESILKKYYREETLASPLAKQVFVFPDRCTDKTGSGFTY